MTAVGSGTSGSSSGSSTNATASAGGYTAQAGVTHKDETVVETETSETESAAETETRQTTPVEEAPTPAAPPALALTLSAEPSQITSTNGTVWLAASVREPSSGVSYKWSASTGSLSKTDGDVTMFSPPENPANGEVAIISCTATCKGYESATTTKSIPFKISN